MTQRDKAWVGVDVGKTHHWVCVVVAEGNSVLRETTVFGGSAVRI
jgi:hypothetical protein